jgi:hypothetical protein
MQNQQVSISSTSGEVPTATIYYQARERKKVSISSTSGEVPTLVNHLSFSSLCSVSISSTSGEVPTHKNGVLKRFPSMVSISSTSGEVPTAPLSDRLSATIIAPEFGGVKFFVNKLPFILNKPSSKTPETPA